MNVLMLVDVGLLLGDAWSFGILASTGQRGMAAVNELATDHGVVGLSHWVDEVSGYVPLREHPSAYNDMVGNNTIPLATHQRKGETTTTAVTSTSTISTPTVFISPHVFSNAPIVMHKSFLESYWMQCMYFYSVELHIGCRNLTHIGGEFLSGCLSIESIDLQALQGITSIGMEFMNGCNSLKSIDLGPLCDIVNIPMKFMNDCSSLQSIDLSPLANVSTVGSYFLLNCSSLTSIDLSPLSKITNIEACFLQGCKELVFVDTTPLYPIRIVGPFCMSACTSLQGANLEGFLGARMIGPAFMRGCTSLLHIDLTPLRHSSISVVGKFLSGCSQLLELDLNPLEHHLRKNALVLDDLPEVSHIYLTTNLRSQVSIGMIRKYHPDGLETRIVWQDQKKSL